ncbi:DUF4198 domain-containing protein [Desulfovibrio sulfodismutans]|uniref:DUF4198 domain-containing protein n=2 Tax=Desulfolutivibrio sulfodismutans TaxID=63561 RepID=A0A7K3NNK9_9BACT|nr:DUF4198 domain-containing protein [Desulfolutivibrio sulfodismutans]QLA14528.1 DUF4198 domain-containing protein [Desulfolutivibrio sulfodismutans DSM 3696]
MVLVVALSASAVFAHNLWVNGGNKEVFEADMIYGHNFPVPEIIAEERLQLFEPLKVFGKDYNEVLTQQGENHHYAGKSKLPDGTYVVEAYYRPTPWVESKNDKWHMNKTRKDFNDDEVVSCSVSSMQSKSLVVVGNDDGSFAMTPLGRGLEITPLTKAGEIRQGESARFRLTRDGQRVKLASILGSYDGYSANEMSFAFYAKTDIDGTFEFKPLHSGVWYLSTVVESPTNDPVCEKRLEKASLVFTVK